MDIFYNTKNGKTVDIRPYTHGEFAISMRSHELGFDGSGLGFGEAINTALGLGWATVHEYQPTSLSIEFPPEITEQKTVDCLYDIVTKYYNHCSGNTKIFVYSGRSSRFDFSTTVGAVKSGTFELISESVVYSDEFWYDIKNSKVIPAPYGHEELVINNPDLFRIDPEMMNAPKKDALRNGFIRVARYGNSTFIEAYRVDRKTKDALSDVAEYLMKRGVSQKSEVVVSEFSIGGMEHYGTMEKMRSTELFEDAPPSFGMNRDSMPQIKDIGLFTDFLKKNSIKFGFVSVPSNLLLGTQVEIDQDKAMDMTDAYGSIVITKDMQVFDGHHRWTFNYNNQEASDCLKVDLPFSELMVMAKKFEQDNLMEELSENLSMFHVMRKSVGKIEFSSLLNEAFGIGDLAYWYHPSSGRWIEVPDGWVHDEYVATHQSTFGLGGIKFDPLKSEVDFEALALRNGWVKIHNWTDGLSLTFGNKSKNSIVDICYDVVKEFKVQNSKRLMIDSPSVDYAGTIQGFLGFEA